LYVPFGSPAIAILPSVTLRHSEDLDPFFGLPATTSGSGRARSAPHMSIMKPFLPERFVADKGCHIVTTAYGHMNVRLLVTDGSCSRCGFPAVPRSRLVDRVPAEACLGVFLFRQAWCIIFPLGPKFGIRSGDP
jgi:hypothetical protein